jgi:peroxiredoxin
MKRSEWLAVLAGALILSGAAGAWGAAAAPQVGGKLPDFSLSAPKEGAEKAYLGLAGAEAFKVPQIKAQAVVIEIFSMYCPYCQKEAPVVNKLYERIEGDPALKGKIKLIGIGAGNSAFEVGVFKKKYGVAFPLFPDADFAVYDRFGELRTPYFMGVKILPDGSHQVIYSALGALGNVERFLAEIVKASDVR